MDFAFSEEQDLLRASARDYLADRWPAERVVSTADAEPSFDATTWRELAAMGWLDTRPDSGIGLLEQAVLAEETAYALLPAPWFSTVALAAPYLDDGLRAAVAEGERAVTLADAAGVTASGDALTGSCPLVPDLAAVTDVVVVTRTAAYVVDLVANPGVVVPRSTMDRTRRLGELRLDGTPARALAADATAAAQVRRRSLALASYEAVGVAQKALDLAAEHAKTREQFGRVIGTYQGVSHKVADIYAQVQLGRSLATWATWAVSEADPQQDAAVAAAKAATTEGAVLSCARATQAHGGVGYTWEHVHHRYYKRAQWLEAFAGNARTHRAAVAAAVLDDEETSAA
jgi:alkylation response protein AidB-like acyl-CoA dehydrogenase